MFNPNDYTNEIAKLAFYPHKGEGNVGALIYCVLGLTGETSETAEKLLESVAKPSGNFDDEAKVEIVKEMGDVLWYLTRTVVELRSTLDEVIPATLTSGNIGDTEDAQKSFSNCVIGLASVSGKLSEILKKILRDDNSTFFDQVADSKRDAMLDALSDVFWWLDRCAVGVGSSMVEVAQSNLDKLSKRKINGTLSGSGDNR